MATPDYCMYGSGLGSRVDRSSLPKTCFRKENHAICGLRRPGLSWIRRPQTRGVHMQSMTLVVRLALGVTVIGLTACGNDGSRNIDAGPDGSTNTARHTDAC